MKEVTEFFAITISGSLYRIWLDDINDIHVEKISLKNSSRSEIETAMSLQKGQFLGITRIGLITYDSENEECYAFPQFVSTKRWRSRTSAIAALFLDKEEAVEEFMRNNLFKMIDPRWQDATNKTLKAISHSHTSFIIPLEEELALPIDF